MCTELDDLTIGDSFSLPNITDILDQLGNVKYFFTLDLASGYHQNPMHEEHKKKTAFSTPHGHFEFKNAIWVKNAAAAAAAAAVHLLWSIYLCFYLSYSYSRIFFLKNAFIVIIFN